MTVVYDERGRRRAFMKGAPEVVAALARTATTCSLTSAAAWAAEGFRVLAVSARALDSDVDSTRRRGRRTRLLGVVALHDPLRETAAAVARRGPRRRASRCGC